MTEKKVEFMIVVPAFLKLLKTGIETELAAAPKFVQIIFKLMFNLAKFIPFYSIKKKMFKKIILIKLLLLYFTLFISRLQQIKKISCKNILNVYIYLFSP